MSARKIGETQGDDFGLAPVVQPIRITKSAEDSDKKVLICVHLDPRKTRSL